MARAAKSRRQSPEQQRDYFIFEIVEWQPGYLMSVNQDCYRDRPYREYANIDLATVCIHPKKWAGRRARIGVSGQENFMTPEILKRDPEWIPRCVVGIHLPPTNATFSFTVPMERLPFLVIALSQGMFRYLSMWGLPLRRSRSLCSEIHFERTVDLSEY